MPAEDGLEELPEHAASAASARARLLPLNILTLLRDLPPTRRRGGSMSFVSHRVGSKYVEKWFTKG